MTTTRTRPPTSEYSRALIEARLYGRQIPSYEIKAADMIAGYEGIRLDGKMEDMREVETNQGWAKRQAKGEKIWTFLKLLRKDARIVVFF